MELTKVSYNYILWIDEGDIYLDVMDDKRELNFTS